jgi:ABC-type sugar transport system ATPase subunit
MSQVLAAEYRGVSKSFGTTRALRDITLAIHEHTIHALVGENGAGKSTALGILAGRVAPSSGRVELFGRPLPPMQPREARRAGVAAIYQELTTIPELSAEANVFVGQPMSQAGFLSVKQMRKRYEELCGQLGVAPVPPGIPAGSLSVADQQSLEIMRGMASDARLILLDEPTASLGIAERRTLLALMRQMRSDGRTIVFVSHNLDEVLEVADTITVFRNGRLVLTSPRAGMTKRELVRNMLGDDADLSLVRSLQEDAGAPVPRGRPRPTAPAGAPVIRAEQLAVPGAVQGVDLEVRAGEILGLGGLVGSGRTSVLRALAGLEPRAAGRLFVAGKEVRWPKTVRRARSYGLALAPEDRKNQGLALEMPAAVNVVMSDLGAVSRWGVISSSRLRSRAQAAAEPFGFDPARVDEPARRLSGGNQQKLLLGRWKHAEPRVLLVDEPTRGIDIGAKEDVLTALEDMAARGLAIIVVSSELEELIVVCDRVLVLAEGRAAGELARDEPAFSVAAILDKAFSGGHGI